MLGKPKFKRDDRVRFTLTIDGAEREFVGRVYVVDAWGTFENNTDVSYDIMSEYGGNPMLFKHIPEKVVRPAD